MMEGDGGVEEEEGVVGVDRHHDGSPGGRFGAAEREGGRDPSSFFSP